MGMLQKIYADLADDPSDNALSQLVALGCDRDMNPVNPMASMAAEYLLKGISVVPQISGEKFPAVKWKPYQEKSPSIHETLDWWQKWPEAGIAFVLGPVSNLFAVDVDGTPAHRALQDSLGRIPKTPTVRSGSGKRHRYHLLFRHPDRQTNAKATPIHAQLEFKGTGGIVVAPPSLHKSGRRYEWLKGRSIFEVELQPVPETIQQSLKEYFGGRSFSNAPTEVPDVRKTVFRSSQHVALTDATLRFLKGEFANKKNWNDRIFRAACDLAGCGYPQQIATEMILAGAQPWDASEENKALRTIESAYSQKRTPGV